MTRAAYCLVGLLRPDASQEGLSKDTTFSQQPSRSCTRARVAVQISSPPPGLSTLRSQRGPHVISDLYTDEEDRGPERSGALPRSELVSWSPLGGRDGRGSESAPSTLSPPTCSVISPHPRRRPAPRRCRALKREFLSHIPGTEFTDLHSPADEHVFFVERPHRGVGISMLFPDLARVGRGPSQIIEPWPHSAGRNLGIASAGASEPPGQLIKDRFLGFRPRVLTQWVWGGTEEPAFLVNSQSVPTPPIHAARLCITGLR